MGATRLGCTLSSLISGIGFPNVEGVVWFSVVLAEF